MKKKTISEKHKDKWATDPDFRARQKKRDQGRRARLREENGRAGLAYYRAKLTAVLEGRGESRCMVIEQGGAMVLMLTVGGLAEVLGRHIVRVQQWLSEGYLPGYTARFRTYRLFSEKYVELICEALHESELQNARGDMKLFSKLIREKVARKHVEVHRGEEKGRKEKGRKEEGRKEKGRKEDQE